MIKEVRMTNMGLNDSILVSLIERCPLGRGSTVITFDGVPVVSEQPDYNVKVLFRKYMYVPL
jgi:hypothetical protein